MTHSLSSSSVEAFAAQAGIPDTTGVLAIGEETFTITAASGEYTARFLNNRTDVAQFTSATLGRDLTREEAMDLITLIENEIPKDQAHVFAPTIAHLKENLPTLGFTKSTPLMVETAPVVPKRVINARQWVWSLSLDCDGN